MRALEQGMIIDYIYEGVVLTGEYLYAMQDGSLVIQADENRLHYIGPGQIERIDV